MKWFRRAIDPNEAQRRQLSDALAAPATTELDIRMCFRLLLGRPPNPEEWEGHSDHAGRPLEPIVAGYLNSLEFARRNLLQPRHGAPEVADYPGFRIHADRSDLQIGQYVLGGAYEPEVATVIQQVLRPGMTVVDIGANIGFFTMLAAAATGPAGAVLAIEPNPDNARLVEASARLNGFAHVTTAQVAAGDAIGMLVLNTTHSNGTTSSPGAEIGQLLQARTVPCLAVDTLVQATWSGRRRVDLVKLDVEGAEYKALLGAAGTIAAHRPVIVSEFSPTFMPGISGIDGPGYLRWIHAQGYTIAAIRKDGPPLDTGQDVDAVMAEFARCGSDHIDLLATPA